MEIIFTTDNRIMSRLIRFFTACRWHHCGATFGDGIIYEARGSHGVVASSVTEFKSRGEWASITIPTRDRESAKRFASKQLGKGYDWRGVFSFFLRNQKQSDEKWYCSELVVAIAEAGGAHIVRKGLANVLPRDLWALPLDIK